MQQSGVSLSQLNRQIRNATETAFPEPVWLIAEVLEMNINRTGHCYMELVEKSELDNKIIAKSRATIWAFKFKILRPYFETTSGSQLAPGMKLLLLAEVAYHELYGASLNIKDIDPAFTMGDLALKRQEVVNKLVSAGVIDMNKELEICDVPQSIAVISSETAAGYGDFQDSLVNNSYGFLFSIKLFPAIVQGDTAEASIISALEKINESEDQFDLAVIIRGGGSQADLQCFNNFDLAMNIAQFPIPIITGIGHERDETIADIVAHKSLKTPTAVAEFLIDTCYNFSELLSTLQNKFEQAIKWIIQEENVQLQKKATEMQHFVQQYLKEESQVLAIQSSKLKYLWKGLSTSRSRDLYIIEEHFLRITKERLILEKDLLTSKERSLEMLRPEKVLARGYSLSYYKGRIIKSVKNIKQGELINTKFNDGQIESKVMKVSDKVERIEESKTKYNTTKNGK